MSPENNHRVHSSALGLLSVYLRSGERLPTVSGWRALLGSRPLYRELIDAAKKCGLLNAVAHHAQYGFSNHGAIQGSTPEIGNPALTVRVELTGEKSALDQFCRDHADLLRDKVITFKTIERWEFHKIIPEPPSPSIALESVRAEREKEPLVGTLLG